MINKSPSDYLSVGDVDPVMFCVDDFHLVDFSSGKFSEEILRQAILVYQHEILKHGFLFQFCMTLLICFPFHHCELEKNSIKKKGCILIIFSDIWRFGKIIVKSALERSHETGFKCRCYFYQFFNPKLIMSVSDVGAFLKRRFQWFFHIKEQTFAMLGSFHAVAQSKAKSHFLEKPRNWICKAVWRFQTSIFCLTLSFNPLLLGTIRRLQESLANFYD